MLKIEYATEKDQAFWRTLDTEISENEIALKIRDKRGYIIKNEEVFVGIMRYNLMWDTVPFLTLIYLDELNRGKGFGKQAVFQWENEMKSLGHKIVMTSTQVDEQAQHFYRRLGYLDRGSLFLDHTVLEQPQELFLLKNL